MVVTVLSVAASFAVAVVAAAGAIVCASIVAESDVAEFVASVVDSATFAVLVLFAGMEDQQHLTEQLMRGSVESHYSY